jgi:tight adherence protein B
MNFLFISIFLIIFAFLLIGAAFGFKFLESQRKSEVSKVLRTIDNTQTTTSQPIEILSDGEQEPGPMRKFFLEFKFYDGLKKRLEGAGLNWSPEGLMAMMALAAILGAFFGMRFHILVFPVISIIVAAIAFGLIPFVFVEFRRRRRLREFEEQFPEALDFVARAVKAGHAFSVGVEMLSTESPEPVRTEFRKVFHEMNLGASMEKALNDLAARVPLVDVRFFVSTVLLQRETGGNLAEILMKLAHIIRARFQLKGQVRAASAHGRITATVLTIIPLALMIGLSIVAPDYLASMARDPDGRIMIFCAIVAQFLGYYFIRRIINIKV